MSPALGGRFFTAEPPGKPSTVLSHVRLYISPDTAKERSLCTKPLEGGVRESANNQAHTNTGLMVLQMLHGLSLVSMLITIGVGNMLDLCFP